MGTKVTKTLLEGLCEANGQQGGTIHQFLPNPTVGSLRMMENEYRELQSVSIEFTGRKAFDKLARNYGETINW